LALVFGANPIQLLAQVGGTVRNVGSAAPGAGAPDFDVTAPPAPAVPSGPLFAVAIAEADGLHVFGESAQAPETETTVGGAIAPPAPTCNAPSPPNCNTTCHVTASGMEPRAFALARTDDGVAWLVYVVTNFDQTIGAFFQQTSDGSSFCTPFTSGDASTGTLHLVRLALDGTAPKEVLSMPIDRPGAKDMFASEWEYPRFVDARGFGKGLAIGVRTGWNTSAVRVIRVDTSKF
jgi:hypothetical protein